MDIKKSFRSLQTYMVLKHERRYTGGDFCFRSLQTYMVLKRGCDMEVEQGSFRSLQTYMVLKLYLLHGRV